MSEAESSAGSSASPGRSVVVDAAAVAIVIDARQLRRRFALARRVLRALFILACFGLVLAAIALPGMSGFRPCRMHQSEAKGVLKNLYVSQESYRAELDVYESASFERMGFVPAQNMAHAPRYAVALTDVVNSAASHSFSGWAFSTDPELAGDVWRITEANDLNNVVNGCRR